jgi:hypothetical protein
MSSGQEEVATQRATFRHFRKDSSTTKEIT